MRLTCCAPSLSLRRPCGRLATPIHSLALASRRMIRHCSAFLVLAFRFPLMNASSLLRLTFMSPPSFRSFQSHTHGFFSAFAHATCSLSVCSQYLGLGFNAPVFIPHNQAELLFRGNSIALNLRGCHSLWPFFPKRSVHALDDAPLHISALFAKRDSDCPVWVSFALLTTSLSLSFPAGTKFFQFPACARHCWRIG